MAGDVETIQIAWNLHVGEDETHRCLTQNLKRLRPVGGLEDMKPEFTEPVRNIHPDHRFVFHNQNGGSGSAAIKRICHD